VKLSFSLHAWVFGGDGQILSVQILDLPFAFVINLGLGTT